MDLIFGPTTDWRLFSQRLAGCACLDTCADTCACIQRSSAYDQGCLSFNYLASVLSSIPLPPVFECNSECSCDPELCGNRVIQLRLENPKWLSVRHVNDVRHRGVFTTRVIGPGECVCVYIGEVISCGEAARREKYQLDNLGHTYILTITESRYPATGTTSGQTDHMYGTDGGKLQTSHANQEGLKSRANPESLKSRANQKGYKSHGGTDWHTNADTEGQTTCVDGFVDSEEQAVASFINHSCSPNCVLLPVRVDHMIPYCAVFASRKIDIDEEVTIDYGKHCELSDRPCLCKSVDCRGFLPRSSSAFDRG